MFKSSAMEAALRFQTAPRRWPLWGGLASKRWAFPSRLELGVDVRALRLVFVMKSLLLLGIIAFCLEGSAVAADGYNFRAATPEDKFSWPKELFHLDPKKFVDVVIDLPRLEDDETIDKPGSATRSAYYVDLNDDGIKEMIVPLGQDGHQEDMGIFQLKERKWVQIGSFQNGCSFLPKWNGYYQLEDTGNGGGGVISRRLLRFIHGQYREVRDEIYERGELSEVRVNPEGLGN
jgi:hypothetical protein